MKAGSPLLLKVQWIKNSDSKSHDTLETNELGYISRKKTWPAQAPEISENGVTSHTDRFMLEASVLPHLHTFMAGG